MGHSVIVQRRSGATFAPIVAGDRVRPNEAIRLLATGIGGVLGFSTPVFQILDASGKEVLEESAARQLFSDRAWLDLQAPPAEGIYTVYCFDWLFPFVKHGATTVFAVSVSAPVPPAEPPKTGFLAGLGDVKVLGLILLGIVAVSAFSRRS